MYLPCVCVFVCLWEAMFKGSIVRWLGGSRLFSVGLDLNLNWETLSVLTGPGYLSQAVST